MEKSIILEKVIFAESCDLEILPSVGSTNDYLKNQPMDIKSDPFLKIVIAQEQTQGRGRLNRSWISPQGQNLYFSCKKHFAKPVNELSALSLVVSLAVVKTLEAYITSGPLSIKWPNDIFYQSAKLSGNLIDIVSSSNSLSTVIIGIGVNINMDQDSGQITQAWTSLKKITGVEYDRNEIAASLINHLIEFFKEFEEKGFEPFLDIWKGYDYLFNQKITLKSTYDEGIIATGIAKGINAQGQLLLEKNDGNIQAFVSGDTSIMNLVYY